QARRQFFADAPESALVPVYGLLPVALGGEEGLLVREIPQAKIAFRSKVLHGWNPCTGPLQPGRRSFHPARCRDFCRRFGAASRLSVFDPSAKVQAKGEYPWRANSRSPVPDRFRVAAAAGRKASLTGSSRH